jgi:hypothetical protein
LTLKIEDFLRDRLDEDQKVAEYAMRSTPGYPDDGVWAMDPEYPSDFGCRIEGQGITIYDEGGHDEYQAAHIARHDPASTLVDLQSKREILADYVNVVALGDVLHNPVNSMVTKVMLRQIRHLASVYSDHPDYDQEW